MKRFMSFLLLIATMSMVGCMSPNSVSVTNVNECDDTDCGAIRVWMIAVGDPIPTTREEADAVWPNFLTFSEVTVSTGDLGVDEWVVLAADESDYQLLDASDSFTDENYTAIVVSVEDGDVFLNVADSEEEGGLPVFSSGSDPFGGDDGGGDDGSDDDGGGDDEEQ